MTDQQLLRDYTGQRSERAFTELVRRHVDFVYSAAVRMVRDAQLAEDVTQAVFVALSKNAGQLTNHPVLSGWLHRTAQNLAANAVRTEVRRRAREQEAVAMNELHAHEADAAWENIAPHLDIALGELSEPDRDARLLRYFERKSAREIAQTLGTSEEAAQKRVNRAVERLRELFSKRNVTIGASGLMVLISANAVQAAPVGLFVTISTAASLAGTTLQTSTAIAATKTIVMTTLQKTFVAAALAVVAGTGIYEASQVSRLREQNRMLRQQQATLAAQIKQLQHDRDEATNRVSVLTDELNRVNKSPSEVLKLRGEVGQLRQKNWDLSEAVRKFMTGVQGPIFLWAARPQLTPEQDRLNLLRNKLDRLEAEDGRRPEMENEIARLVEELGAASELRSARANELVISRKNDSHTSEIHNPTKETLVFTVNTKDDVEQVGSFIGSIGREVFLPPNGRLIVPDLVWVSPKMSEADDNAP